jgi:hypothetical protein
MALAWKVPVSPGVWVSQVRGWNGFIAVN